MGLERTRALLDEVGSPERGLKGVLVAGTNGKGSTCAFIAAALQQAGLRVAGMPKPHLQSYTERVTIDGQPITEAAFAAAVSALVPAIDRVAAVHGAPTEFEILTALALRHARDRGVDLLVCEVGMGGRLDATNVTALGVKVITSIDLDHMQYLGDTIAEIAAEKAGIIARGDLVVCGRLHPEALEVVEARCRREGARLWLAGRDFDAEHPQADRDGIRFDFAAAPGNGLHAVPGLVSSMLGAHQAGNAAVAVAALQAMTAVHGLDLPDAAIQAGVAAARWPGRLEMFPGRPEVLVDGGHNAAAVAAVVGTVHHLFPGVTPVVLFAAMSDKDVPAMLRVLPPAWPAVLTAVAGDRALDPKSLAGLAASAGRGADVAVDGVPAALAEARRRAGERGLVLVLGSLYLAGEVRPMLAAAGSPIFEE